MFTDLAEAY